MAMNLSIFSEISFSQSGAILSSIKDPGRSFSRLTNTGQLRRVAGDNLIINTIKPLMGAVCYKPKNLKDGKLSKDDVIRAINDQTIKETIGDTEGGQRTRNFEATTSQMINTTQGNNSRIVPVKFEKQKK